MIPRIALVVFSAVLVTLQAPLASAAIIATRADLNTALGGSTTTENFENWSGGGLSVGATLNSSTTAGGQGPGIVNADLEFRATGNGGLMLSRGEGGASFDGSLIGDGVLVIDFLDAVTHFGIDYFSPPGFLFTDTQIRVFATDDSTLIHTFTNTSTPPHVSPAFFGFEDLNGIGRVTVHNLNISRSSFIDDVTYGNAPVPEPSSLLVFAGIGICGLVLARRTRTLSAPLFVRQPRA